MQQHCPRRQGKCKDTRAAVQLQINSVQVMLDSNTCKTITINGCEIQKWQGIMMMEIVVLKVYNHLFF